VIIFLSIINQLIFNENTKLSDYAHGIQIFKGEAQTQFDSHLQENTSYFHWKIFRLMTLRKTITRMLENITNPKQTG
jgi:hypothetical protein